MNKLMFNMALPIVVGLVKDMLSPENFKTYGSLLFGVIRKYVKDTTTKVDDKLVLPLLDSAEKMLWPQDND